MSEEKKSKKRKKYDRRSFWWRFFEEVVKDEEAKCNIENCPNPKVEPKRINKPSEKTHGKVS